jgi:hypothetical protein
MNYELRITNYEYESYWIMNLEFGIFKLEP